MNTCQCLEENLKMEIFSLSSQCVSGIAFVTSSGDEGQHLLVNEGVRTKWASCFPLPLPIRGSMLRYPEEIKYSPGKLN